MKLWQSSHRLLSLLLPWLLRLTPGTESQSHTPCSLQQGCRSSMWGVPVNKSLVFDMLGDSPQAEISICTHTHTHCYVLVNVPFYVQTFTSSILIKEVVLVLWHWFNGCSWFLFLSSEHSFLSIYHACVVVKHVIHQHLYCIIYVSTQANPQQLCQLCISNIFSPVQM